MIEFKRWQIRERNMTQKLLKKSIGVWEEKMVIHHPDNVVMGTRGCPLCKIYHNRAFGCGGCPIYEATNGRYCQLTPYPEALEALRDWGWSKIAPSSESEDDKKREWHRAAREMINFMKALVEC